MKKPLFPQGGVSKSPGLSFEVSSHSGAYTILTYGYLWAIDQEPARINGRFSHREGILWTIWWSLSDSSRSSLASGVINGDCWKKSSVVPEFDDDFPMEIHGQTLGTFFQPGLTTRVGFHYMCLGWGGSKTAAKCPDPRQTQPGRPSRNNSYDVMVFSAKHLSEKVCYRVMGFSDIFKT